MDDIINDIRKLIEVTIGSEDDLIIKVVLPFMYYLGYNSTEIELKYPISSYRPNKVGRKPEADCVIFSESEHNVNTSLIVIEVKKSAQDNSAEQARFYSANLFVPFYIAWEEFDFVIYQLHNFQGPTKLGKWSLNSLDLTEFNKLKLILSKNSILSFCERNEIKRFEINNEIKKIEALYLNNLHRDLCCYKLLDLARNLNLLENYIALEIQELSDNYLPLNDIEKDIENGAHPIELEEQFRKSKQSFLIEQVIDQVSTISVIGDPGSGKTTLLKNLCLQNCYSNSNKFPVFIAIRELIATDQSLMQMINRLIKRYGIIDCSDAIFDHVVSEGRLLLCIDGLDELDIKDPTSARIALRKLTIEFNDIVVKNSNNTFIVSARRESWPTCRSEIPPYFAEYEILPLSHFSIRNFISKWFSGEEQEFSDSLIDEFLRHGWPEFASNPLLLALICIVYEKRGQLPDRLSLLCQKCIDVILEEWDATRRISRRNIIKGLTPERKLDILTEVALSFHIRRRACFSREEIIREFRLHLPKVGLAPEDAGDAFDEISSQHGLIKSWSIEDYYAFPHLVFQEYLAAKALRDRAEGFKELIKRKDDPFWKKTLLIYSGMGDNNDIINELLHSEDTIIHSNLFLVAECLGAGGKLTNIDLRKEAIDRIKDITKIEITYLRNRAIDALITIDAPDSLDIIRSLLRNGDNKLVDKYIIRYSINVDGYETAQEIIDRVINKKDFSFGYFAIDAFRRLPQRNAIPILEEVFENINVNDYELKRSLSFLRRKVAYKMAEYWDSDALPILERILVKDYLTEIEKQGIVYALGLIRHPRVSILMKEILLSESLPIDCKIMAAHFLGPDDQEAKVYLLSIIADKDADYFDRRDAMSELTKYKLCETDIPIINILLFDPDPIFWAGPHFASKAIKNIGCQAGLSCLQNAILFWEKVDYAEKNIIINTIKEQLAFAQRDNKIFEIVDNHLQEKNKQFHWDKLEIYEFYQINPDKAYNLFLKALNEYDKDIIYGGGYWVGDILSIVPKIPITKEMIKAIIELANKTYKSEDAWRTLGQLWKRQDIDKEIREVFFKKGLAFGI